MNTRPALFWLRWLTAVSLGVMVFGLIMVVAPELTRRGFSLLIYSSAGHIDTFGGDAVAYISLVHAVLGAVMFGWGVVLLMIVNGAFARGAREGWYMIMVCILAWFVPDTAFSLWSGFWLNAILNLPFLILFIIPLAATYSVFQRRTQE